MLSSLELLPLTPSLKSLFFSRWPLLHEEVLLSSISTLSLKSLQPEVAKSSAATSPELSNYPQWFFYIAISGKGATMHKFFSDYLISWIGYSRIPSLECHISFLLELCQIPFIYFLIITWAHLSAMPLVAYSWRPPPNTALCNSCHHQYWLYPSLHQGTSSNMASIAPILVRPIATLMTGSKQFCSLPSFNNGFVWSAKLKHMETGFLNNFPKVSGDMTQTCREANTHGKTLIKEAGDGWEEKMNPSPFLPSMGCSWTWCSTQPHWRYSMWLTRQPSFLKAVVTSVRDHLLFASLPSFLSSLFPHSHCPRMYLW